MRRRDPVKRTAWVGAVLAALVLVWSSSLQMKSMLAKGEVNRLQTDVAKLNNEYQQVINNQKKLGEVTTRTTALHKLASNRFLYGTLLNGLQQTTVDDVQLTRMRVDQGYTITEEVKPKPNAEKPVAAKPATSTERIVVTLEAKDCGMNPGDQVNKFKIAVAESAYFQSLMGKTNEVRLTSLSPPQSLGGKPYVQFTLECKLPEKTR